MLRKKALGVALALCLAATALAGCSRPASEPTQAAITFVDDLQNQVQLAKRPERVVSALGSYAETWVLAGGTIVGTTEDAVSERNMELGEDVAIIGTVKSPNAEKILELQPDLVLLSADIEGHVRLAQTLKDAQIPCAFFKVDLFEDYLRMLKTCTELTGRADLYEQNGTAVQRRVQRAVETAQAQPTHPKVLFLRALGTGAKAKGDDNMTGAMIRDLGAVNIASQHPSLLEDVSMEVILQEDPDIILVTTMGDSERAMEAFEKAFVQNPAWGELTAVQNDRLVLLDKQLFHYKPNARWGESYEALLHILYPDAQ